AGSPSLDPVPNELSDVAETLSSYRHAADPPRVQDEGPPTLARHASMPSAESITPVKPTRQHEEPRAAQPPPLPGVPPRRPSQIQLDPARDQKPEPALPPPRIAAPSEARALAAPAPEMSEEAETSARPQAPRPDSDALAHARTALAI